MDDPVLARLITRFAEADACWFSSTRPDGRAHLAPIWHVWHAGRIYVVTQSTTVRARNIALQPAVSLALPDTKNVMIVEGIARVAPEKEEVLNPLFKAKYKWEFTKDNPYHHIIEVTPRKIIAWKTDGDSGGRWHFEAEGNLQSSSINLQEESESA
jgi:general stress protein 26